MNQVKTILAVSILLACQWEVVWGRGATMELRNRHVVVQDDNLPGAGPYFVMEINVPVGLVAERLQGAVLEFVVNADSRADTIWIQDADTLRSVVHSTPVPLIEIYALASSGTASDSGTWNSEFSFPVPVGVGSEKMVRVDITRLVKHWIENPEDNHGIVVGSLTGGRFGLFTLREHFDSGVIARVRYVY